MSSEKEEAKSDGSDENVGRNEGTTVRFHALYGKRKGELQKQVIIARY